MLDMIAGNSDPAAIHKDEIEYGLGFEAYPRWLVSNGLASMRISGRLFHPDEFMDLPTAWVDDVFRLARWEEAKKRDKGKDS